MVGLLISALGTAFWVSERKELVEWVVRWVVRSCAAWDWVRVGVCIRALHGVGVWSGAEEEEGRGEEVIGMGMPLREVMECVGDGC